jgi:phosphopantetheinyl transferase (holo-ACP synthase)
MNHIFGIGTDIVDISRIKHIFNKNKNFKNKIFSKKEIRYCEAKINLLHIQKGVLQKKPSLKP